MTRYVYTNTKLSCYVTRYQPANAVIYIVVDVEDHRCTI